MKKKFLLDIFYKNKNQIFIKDEINNENFTYGRFLNIVKERIYLFQNLNLKINSKILILRENSVDYLINILASCLGGYVIMPVDPEINTNRISAIKKLIKFDLILDKKIIRSKNSFKKKPADLIYLKNSEFLYMLSSGTQSEEAKALIFDSDTIINSSESFAKLIKSNNKSIILHCLPMFYMAGILNTFFSSIFSKSKIVLTKKFSIFDINNFIKVCSKNKINIFHLTPDIYRILCKTLKKKEILKIFKNAKKLISTGSVLHQEIKHKFKFNFNRKILSCYGLTELGGPLTLQNKSNAMNLFSVGNHDKKVKIKIKKNLIFINSPFKAKKIITISGSKKIKSNNGYYNTGDIGKYINKELYVTGRERDIIKKGGELISLSMIESIFLTRDDIIEVAAVPLFADNNKEENYVVFLNINGEYDFENKIEELTNFYKKNLKLIEYPKKILIVEKMPKTSSGKIKKKILMKNYYI